MRQTTQQQQPLLLQAADGTPLVFADKAAFLAASHDIIWKRNGTALATQPTWDLTPDAAVSGLYHINYIAPAGDWAAVVEMDDAELAEPLAFYATAIENDSDTLAAIIQASGGTISPTDGVISANLRLYEGDSIATLAAVPENILSRVGATSLADLDSITAGLKLSSTGSAAEPDLVILPASITIITDTVGNRVIRITVDAFPEEISVGAGARGAVVRGRIDVRVTKDSVTRIASKIDVGAEWSARP